MAGVYQIYNTETGKRYIGSSIDVERRLKEHYRNLKHHKPGLICFYPSLREAARQLGVDKKGIQHVLKNTNGIMKKLKCVFERITKEEYERSKSKK